MMDAAPDLRTLSRLPGNRLELRRFSSFRNRKLLHAVANKGTTAYLGPIEGPG